MAQKSTAVGSSHTEILIKHSKPNQGSLDLSAFGKLAIQEGSSYLKQ